MRVISYTTREGGSWKRWRKWKGSARFHALRFSNGKVWDTYNGWRDQRYPRQRLRKRNA